MRLFAGIDLDDRWRNALAVLKDSVLQSDPEWRRASWVPPANSHVTLGFFGEVDPQDLERLKSALADVAAEFERFELPLDEVIRAVPTQRRAKMLWGTLVDPDGQAAELAERVRSEASLITGQIDEPREYRPHVTLARSRPARAIDIGAVRTSSYLGLLGYAPSVSVPGVTLFESKLSRAGARYTRLAFLPLRSD